MVSIATRNVTVASVLIIAILWQDVFVRMDGAVNSVWTISMNAILSQFLVQVLFVDKQMSCDKHVDERNLNEATMIIDF